MQPNIISHAAEKSGYAIEAAEEQKYAQYENSCAQQGILLVPLAITFARSVEVSEEGLTEHVVVS